MSDRLSLELEPADTLRLANLCGQFDAHLKQIESRVGVEIFCRGNLFTIQGPERASRAARRLLINLYRLAENEVLTPDLVNLHLQESGVAELGEPGEADPRGEVVWESETYTLPKPALPPAPVVSASIPAAVMTVAAFRVFRADGTILEANLSQTIGSASSSVATPT